MWILFYEALKGNISKSFKEFRAICWPINQTFSHLLLKWIYAYVLQSWASFGADGFEGQLAGYQVADIVYLF